MYREIPRICASVCNALAMYFPASSSSFSDDEIKCATNEFIIIAVFAPWIDLLSIIVWSRLFAAVRGWTHPAPELLQLSPRASLINAPSPDFNCQNKRTVCEWCNMSKRLLCLCDGVSVCNVTPPRYTQYRQFICGSAGLCFTLIVLVCVASTCLRYFLPPNWVMDKDHVSTLTTDDLARFPLDDFFDHYEKGLRKVRTCLPACLRVLV